MPDTTAKLVAKLRTRPELLPRHIAIIMDGSGRWARRRALPRLAGHREGRRSVRAAVETCLDLGVEYLTLYTFSLENWRRPRAEVDGLMKFLHRTLVEEREDLKRNGVSMAVVGDIPKLPESVRRAIHETTSYLAEGTRLRLVLAISYGARQELVHAMKSVAADVQAGRLKASQIDEELVSERLWTHGIPDPDLLIRTSGEMRVSNFLLWQIAYAEIWVTPVLWPDFRGRHLLEGIQDFLKRERRFGGLDVRPKRH